MGLTLVENGETVQHGAILIVAGATEDATAYLGSARSDRDVRIIECVDPSGLHAAVTASRGVDHVVLVGLRGDASVDSKDALRRLVAGVDLTVDVRSLRLVASVLDRHQFVQAQVGLDRALLFFERVPNEEQSVMADRDEILLAMDDIISASITREQELLSIVHFAGMPGELPADPKVVHAARRVEDFRQGLRRLVYDLRWSASRRRGSRRRR